MKLSLVIGNALVMGSPLAEGRELKYANQPRIKADGESPLAEGRELKLSVTGFLLAKETRRPSRRGVN